MSDLATINRVHKKGEFDRAERLYLDYLKAHPDCAMAHALMGTLKLQQGYHGLALQWSKKALAIDANVESCHGDMMVAYRRLGRIDDAIDLGRKAIELFGEHWDGLHKAKRDGLKVAANILNNLGANCLECGFYEEAEAVLSRAKRYCPDHADANWNYGLIRLAQKKWDGWSGYEFGFRVGERRGRPYADEYPHWEGQNLKGKTILVWGEQGVGDEILFAQCLPDLKKLAKKVVFDCHPRLVKLFQQSFPTIECVGTRKDFSPGLFDDHRIDYHVPIGGLPFWFRNKDEQFGGAYLKANRKNVERLRKERAGFRVGLAWRGGSARTGQRKRSMSLEQMLAAVEVRPDTLLDNLQLIALQYGEGVAEDVDAVKKFTGQDVYLDEGAIEDFSQQADLTASCDLVISVVQTTAHLAGALGVPTYCLVPHGPPWKFPHGKENPWHSSMVQYHQEKQYDWWTPIAQIRQDLEAAITMAQVA